MTRRSPQRLRQGIPGFLNTLPRRDSVRLEEEHLPVQPGITTVKWEGFCNWLTGRITLRVISTTTRMVLAGEIHGVAEQVAVNLRIRMKIYNSIQELLGELSDLNWDSAIFINQSAWVADPLHTEILFLEGDDELEDVVPGTHLPKIANDKGMQQLFDTETFRGIVGFERRRNSEASVSDIVHAINYYREKDDFYDPRG
nr:hypothetical protein [Burkholderia sp. JKS000303]